MQNSWMSLVPPLVVLMFGFVTRRVIPSISCGIIVAALIAQNLSITNSLHLILNRIWVNSELWKLYSWQTFWTSWNLFICVFLFALAIIVTLISYSGAAYAYGRFARRRMHDIKDAESASLTLSSFFFFDDYFSSLTVGAVMHPLTDVFKVPRVKLAFLVDAMAAPLAILCPVSSWVAAIVGFLTENGISLKASANTLILADPFWVYICIIPFLFYSFTIMSSAWFIVRKRISFGSMQQHEKIAQTTGNLFGSKESISHKIRIAPEHNKQTASIADFFFPIIILIISVFSGMLFSGNYHFFGGTRSFIAALQHSNAAITLFMGGLIGVIFCTLFLLFRKKIVLTEIPEIYWDGIKLMAPAVAVLMLAWTLGDILRSDLLTGQYLASIIPSGLSIQFLPTIFFALSLAISFAIGSSWGTIAILLPIAIPMLVTLSHMPVPIITQNLPLLFPMLGAIFSGAIAGDHISPISDTTVMSSTSTGCHHIDHVQTQMTYALPVVCSTAFGFLVTGLLIPYGLWVAAISAGTSSILLSIVLLYAINYYTKSNS